MHPTNADLWLLAIRFEADGTGPQAKEGGIGGGNIDAARKLVLRALRFMKSAKEEEGRKIWLEWVRLEMSFIERMRKRWEIMSIQDIMSGKPNVQQDAAEMSNGVLPEPDQDMLAETGEEQDLASTATQIQSTKQKGQHAVLGGDIVRVVLTSALACECSIHGENVLGAK